MSACARVYECVSVYVSTYLRTCARVCMRACVSLCLLALFVLLDILSADTALGENTGAEGDIWRKCKVR